VLSPSRLAAGRPGSLGQWRLQSATDGTPKSKQPPDASHHTALFRSAGTVVNAHVVRQSSGRSKGWALVDFASGAEAQQVRGVPAVLYQPVGGDSALCVLTTRPYAQAAATLNNTDFGGRSIAVRVKAAHSEAVKAPAAKAPRGAASNGAKPARAPRAPRVPGTGNAALAARPERPENSSGRQIVVRNLPWTTTSEDLREVFQQVGTVIEAVAVRHEDTGRSKGWGTVMFETEAQAQAAIQGFSNVELEGRAMLIRMDRYN